MTVGETARVQSSGREPKRLRAAAACLVGASGLAIVGTFVPLYDEPSAPGGSIKLYKTLHYNLPVWVIMLVIPAGLGYLAFTRRDQIVAALIVGYCAPAVSGLATYAIGLTVSRGPVLSFGRGYYLLTAAYAAQVAAAILAATVLLTVTNDRARPSGRSARFAVPAALLLAAAHALRPERFRGLSIWEFDRVPARLGAAIVVGLVVVALIPLVALRIGSRAAAFIAIALAVAQALVAGDAVLEHFYAPRFNELTAGFWIVILAVAALVGLAWSLLRSAADAPLTPAGGARPHAAL